ncbi:MAG: hypothetical protein ACRC2J_12565, partial [Microcoleaceae cyanobacterium]
MSFNTGNPIGSISEEDCYDNMANLDRAMNTTNPTWRDRFNVEKPTIDAALKSAGFMPAGFDFVTGGTLQPGDRNKAVFNPAPNGDNNWYRWNGAFPKVVPANSQPEPKNESSWVPVDTDKIIREDLLKPGGSGIIADLVKPITWSGFNGGGIIGDIDSNNKSITAMADKDAVAFFPEGFWENTVDSTFNIYPDMRNYSGGLKIKRGLPGKGTKKFHPLIWAEKISNSKREPGGNRIFDVAMQGSLTLEPTATAFGVGVSGYIRSSAGDVSTPGQSIDGIGVHGSGKAIGKNGRVWGMWAQAGNGDSG